MARSCCNVKAGGALPYAVRCGRVDDDYLDKALDGLAHAESWPSALTDVEEDDLVLEAGTKVIFKIYWDGKGVGACEVCGL